jgi:PadR family transcriptional regulator, regulatory protein PadR
MTGAVRHEPSDSRFPRDYLRGCLLLLVAESPTHGYELIEQMCALGVRSSDTARVYRTLRTMEEQGLVVSQWEHSASGPARRTYRPTEVGEKWLRAWASALAECHRHFSACLARHRLVGSRTSAGGAG